MPKELTFSEKNEISTQKYMKGIKFSKRKEGSNGQNIFSKQAQLAKKGSQKSLI